MVGFFGKTSQTLYIVLLYYMILGWPSIRITDLKCKIKLFDFKLHMMMEIWAARVKIHDNFDKTLLSYSMVEIYAYKHNIRKIL